MSINDSTLAAAKRLRTQLARMDADQTRAMTKAWVEAWDYVAADLEAALQQLALEAGEGTITRKAVIRSERLRKSLDAIRASLDDLFAQSGQTVIDNLADVVNQAGIAQETIIGSQLPAAERAIVKAWSTVDQAQIEAIVIRTTEQITKLTYPLSDEATAVMRRELVSGMVGGKNPRDVAAKMLKHTEDLFNGGLSRALTIARTEMLDAHRAAGKLADEANADILTSWIWTAALSTKTCPACWGMHGTEFPLSQAGPEGHQNCRCTRVSKTKTWAELGFTGMAEPSSIMPNRDTVFNALPPESQREVLGPKRYDAWQSGNYPMDSWATKRSTPEWRDSWVVSPVAA